MEEGPALPIAVVLTGGLIEPEWRRFAEALRPRWPAPVEFRPALPASDWDGILMTEGAALLPALSGLRPQAAELIAAKTLVRVGSHGAAERVLSARLVLGLIPGDAWFHWLFPEQGGAGAELYGLRDIAQALGVPGREVPGQPAYGRYQDPARDLPQLVADYLEAALR